jgi:hypothetical protein
VHTPCASVQQCPPSGYSRETPDPTSLDWASVPECRPSPWPIGQALVSGVRV